MHVSERLVGAIEAAANRNTPSRSQLEDIQFYTKYAEPGYQDPKSGMIALGNWNNPTRWDKEANQVRTTCNLMGRVTRLLEYHGVELEWNDEWSSCCDCGGLVRTQANSYDWRPSYHLLDGELLCADCVARDASSLLETLEGDPTTALTLDSVDPAGYGYRQVKDKLENGFHAGMAASPKVIAEEMERLGIDRYLFKLDETSQFYMTFSLWVHESELDRYSDAINTDQYPSPAQKLDSALSGVRITPSEPGQINLTSIDVDQGTSTTRVVTTEEFINGIKP